MARFKVVHKQSWDDMYQSILFESENEETAVMAAGQLSSEPENTYIVIDSWNRVNQLSSSAKALLRTEKELADFITKNRAATKVKRKN